MKTLLKYLIAKKRFQTSRLDPICLISYDSKLEGKNYVGAQAKILSSRLGKYSYVGSNSELMLSNVSRYVSIAPSVIIGLQGHNLRLASTYPPFWYSNQTCSVGITGTNGIEYSFEKTTVEADCWIGHSALIMAGVKLGTGSVVGAGAVVTRDLEPFGIYAGSPAKLIRYRFNSHDISRLLDSQWWNLDFLEAQAFLSNFSQT